MSTTEPISSADISVVVQGPIAGKPGDPPEKRLTLLCLQSVRRHLPDAEIVLSTWRGANVEGLDYDILLENEDPGGTIFRTDGKTLNNVNRQIVSTRNGLLKASRSYCMKLRSDMMLEGSDFLGYMGQFSARADDWRLLKQRVLGCTIYASNPRRKIPYCFHPSDWYFFGRREDMLDIWDIPLAPEPEMSQWLAHRPRPKPDYDSGNLTRYAPEQYIWLSFLRKHRPVDFDFQWDVSEELIHASQLSIVNNVVLLEPEQLQIVFMKAAVLKTHFSRLYTHFDWLHLYKRYCDPSFRVAPDPDTLRVHWQRRAIGTSEKIKWLSRRTYGRIRHVVIGSSGLILRPIRAGIHFVGVIFRYEGRIRRTIRRIIPNGRAR